MHTLPSQHTRRSDGCGKHAPPLEARLSKRGAIEVMSLSSGVDRKFVCCLLKWIEVTLMSLWSGSFSNNLRSLAR